MVQEPSSRRLPPQNLEAEQSVLGAVLIDNEALATARRIITTRDFYREPHRVLFQGMCELADLGQAIDAIHR
jgi:replicative DNA helicase